MGQVKNEQLLKAIALIVRDLRVSAKISQEEVYNDTNIHIGRIEATSLNISISTLFVLCTYFNITLSDFFKRVESVYKK